MKEENILILFICTANICRSPMAEALFKARLRTARQDWDKFRVESAGVMGLDGEPASLYAQMVIGRRGLDISGHRARMVTKELVDRAALILTMEIEHKEMLRAEFPYAASKIFLLTEMQFSKESIVDPYGEPIYAYEQTAILLDQIIEKGLQQILSLAESYRSG